jgi:HPt (histidine-containing phosphotransfer) domain-containing protein
MTDQFDLIAYFNERAHKNDENAANVTNAEIRMICEEDAARCRMVVAEITRLRARVAELEAQVAARDEAVRVLAELYLSRHDACESAHGLNLLASPAALTRLVHAMEAARGNPIAIAAITDARKKERS